MGMARRSPVSVVSLDCQLLGPEATLQIEEVPQMGRIEKTKTVFESPWCSLLEKQVGGWDSPHYSIKEDDYVCIIAVRNSNILLVSQYRPAIEMMTLELPSGHVDGGEDSDTAVRRELLEETGFRAGTLHFLGTMAPDVGRMNNRQHCFFTDELIEEQDGSREAGVSCQEMALGEFKALIGTDRFPHAPHVAALMLALQKGHLRL
jgi:ADP-ribose pyrophosphatase